MGEAELAGSWKTGRSVTVLELAFGGLAAALITWSLLAVALAQVGLFRAWPLLAAGLISAAAGVGFWWVQRSVIGRAAQREVIFLVLLLSAGLLLYAWPAEHYPLVGDSAIYPGTAARLIRDHGLVYHYAPLDDLSLAQKQLFYVPADQQLPHIEIQSYKGLLFGAYYVMEPGQNLVVSSRPPLTIVWMGLFGKLFGLHGMLYVIPFFGALSLGVLYFLGKRLFGPAAGALAAVWLLVSFLQLHFSRTPYAEVIGQFFVLVTLYGLVTYLQTRRACFLVLGIAALAAGFAARIDTILILPVLFFYILILIRRRDNRGLALILVSLCVAAGFTWLTVTRPYVGATAELLLAAQLRMLREPAIMITGTALGASGLILLPLAVRRAPRATLPRVVRGALILLLIAAVGYGLHIRPLMPERVWALEQWHRTYNEELMAVTAQYISGLVIWLAAAGAALLLWRKRVFSAQAFFLIFVTSLAAVFFWKYTTARIYPVALRRLAPEVFPGLLLLGAYAVQWLAHRRRWRPVAAIIAGLVIVLQLGVASPYWFYREAPGTLDFVNGLAESLPADAIVLFEPQGENSVVGWFAAPLWSFHNRNALLFNKGELDGGALQGALCHWQQAGRSVYVVTQNSPEQWWPGRFTGQREGEANWRSSIIGQSLLFPPYVWQFDFVFSIYRLGMVDCPA